MQPDTSPQCREVLSHTVKTSSPLEWIMEYGGPFATKQVEDVQTFWRILVVVGIISSLHLAVLPLHNSAESLEKNFGDFYSQTQCIHASTSGTYTPTAIITYSIPLYELLIYEGLPSCSQLV